MSILFYGKNKKNILNLSSVESAKKVENFEENNIPSNCNSSNIFGTM